MTISLLPAERLKSAFNTVATVEVVGRVAEAAGTVIRATGISAAIGEICELRNPITGVCIEAEVVGISQTYTLLTPFNQLQGISSQTQVISTGRRHEIAVDDTLLGRVIDAHMQPIDGLPVLQAGFKAPVYRSPPDPIQRPLISNPFSTGVRAIDTVLTCGVGQRVGIFAVAGGGKSTLLGMLARGASSDVNVVALVGERGREVREFLEDNLGRDGLAKSVVVVATSDRPAMERARAAYVATAVAEYFRDQGKNVLFMMDSVTRFARALRDVGLSIGEMPARQGFPPSVFSELPRLFERTGADAHGSITAFYTVLMEDEDGSDPIAEEVRSILDGHIILSRKLASAAHFPAIDVLRSASRVMGRVVDSTHAKSAARVRELMAKHQEIELLLQLGEYKPGGDPQADMAIARISPIRSLLQQRSDELTPMSESIKRLSETVS
jgi:ATP synthase in type III secretion protein N